MTNTAPLRLAILGATGRMGHALVDAVLQNPALKLSAALALPGSPGFGADAGSLVGRPATGVIVGNDLAEAAAAAEVFVDFTRPEGTLAALDSCVAHGRSIVIGTTGFDAAQKQHIAAAALKIPLCMAANFSVGVNICLRLLEVAAKSLGPGYDVEIVEAHHRGKVDAPSGTALRMGEAVAGALGRKLDDCAIHGRRGTTGARDATSIGFAVVRGGDIVGDHSVMFLGEGERVEISHKASSRANFAQGALRAALWLRDRVPGHYEMRDVLGLNAPV